MNLNHTRLMRLHVLELLYEYQPADAGELAPIDLIPDGVDERDQLAWTELLRELYADGLILLSATASFGGLGAIITGPGRAEVENSRRRRADPALRRAAARDTALQWISTHPHNLAGMSQDGWFHFEGVPFTSDELNQAVQYLHSKGLVVGIPCDGAVVAAALTVAGLDCIDIYGGSVGEYVRRREGNGTSNTVNFHGPVSGSNIGWQAETLTQTASTTGIAGDELKLIVRALRQAAPLLGLAEEDAESFQRDLDTAEEELARPEPDKAVATSFVRRAAAAVEKQAESALGLVLTAYVKWQLQKMGIPPQ